MLRNLVLLAILTLSSLSPVQAGDRVLVFAAASLKDVLETAADRYRRDTGNEVVISFAASSVLAKQIDAGAPADLYISANESWMDWLAERNDVLADSLIAIARNRLVIASAEYGNEMPASLLARRFAMGDPGHVPAGQYARQALLKLDLFEQVRANAVYGENVRVALEWLARGEVTAAIVYASDVKERPELYLAYQFDQDSHDAIRYLGAMTRNGNPAGRQFLAFLASPEGQAIFIEAGFGE